MSLVNDVINAHGGLARWRQAAAVSLELSSGGLAFATKGQRTALHDVRATVATTGQVVNLEAPGWSHRFDSGIPAPRRMRWTTADIAAFAACALWTYVAASSDDTTMRRSGISSGGPSGVSQNDQLADDDDPAGPTDAWRWSA